MKIIKDGKLARQVTCQYCECIYEYNGEDVKTEYDYANSYIQSSYYVNEDRKYVECPQCGEKHYLKIKDKNYE